MLLKHFFLPKIAHSSWLLAGDDTCAVIDPQRDVDIYIREARALGVAITHVLETHLHADFISGHLELARRCGAAIVAPRSAGCSFPHRAVAEGDEIEIEHMRLRVLETPGHTPEHVSYVVSDTMRGAQPIGVFCGDTLFVGDVGRPDLFPGRAAELAEQLYRSLHVKLLKLPDSCEVYPAHGAGSLCGRAMGAKWWSTIGFERAANPALRIGDLQEFIRSLTTDMPPAPDHFGRCSEINRRGPALLSDLPVPEELPPRRFAALRDEAGHAVLDVRSYAAYSGMHVPGAWHVDLNGNFPTFVGWVLPVDKDILVVADSHEDAQAAVAWARRVGCDRMVASLDGGMAAWATAGLRTAALPLVSAQELYERLQASSAVVLIDVRTPQEFAAGHIEGACNLPAPDLRRRWRELDPGRPTYLTCSSGNRSSLAASILEPHGFTSLFNVAGGMTGYSAAGHSRRCRACHSPHGPHVGPGEPLAEGWRE